LRRAQRERAAIAVGGFDPARQGPREARASMLVST
jgi:hypothetical protein